MDKERETITRLRRALHLALLAADNCKSNLEYLQEVTGEELEAEDRAILAANFADLDAIRSEAIQP